MQNAAAHLNVHRVVADIGALSVHAEEGEAGSVAGDARTYVIHAVFLYLCDVFRIAEQLAAKAHRVDPACCDRCCGVLGLHASRAYYRLAREFLYVLYV